MLVLYQKQLGSLNDTAGHSYGVRKGGERKKNIKDAGFMCINLKGNAKQEDI